MDDDRPRSNDQYIICGTDEYMAPEVECGLEYSFPADLWSTAILYLQMYTGLNDEGILKHPLVKQRKTSIESLRSAQYTSVSVLIPELDDQAINVLELVMQGNKDCRPTASKLVKDLIEIEDSATAKPSLRAQLKRQKELLDAAQEKYTELEKAMANELMEKMGWNQLNEELADRGLHNRGSTQELAIRLARDEAEGDEAAGCTTPKELREPAPAITALAYPATNAAPATTTADTTEEKNGI